MDYHKFPRDTSIDVTLIARLLLSPVAQKLCNYEQDIFKKRTRVRSQKLLRTEIACCCIVKHLAVPMLKSNEKEQYTGR
jgi:hypothetical protein